MVTGFDMFTDSRLMAIAIKIWRTVQQCDFYNNEHQTALVFQDKP